MKAMLISFAVDLMVGVAYALLRVKSLGRGWSDETNHMD
jgi:xanthosine utilization system XapX-like protein